MNIRILQLLESTRSARGLTVIIDVFRAFSTACYAFQKGVEKIIPVGNIEGSYQLKKDNPSYVLAGERNEMKPHGFDFDLCLQLNVFNFVLKVEEGNPHPFLKRIDS